jgi:hypothetical protein
MWRHHMKTMRVCAALIGLAVAMACSASTDSAPLDREIARLEELLTSLEKADLPEDVKGSIAGQRAALERAKRATSPDYKLYRLRDPFTGIETLSFLAKEKASGESVAHFEKLWNANEARFAAKAPAAQGTLVARGLAESASTRAERLYRASLPYSKASAPWSGVYYLGEAEANLRWREFLQTLGTSAEKTPARERVAAMVEDLEGITLKHFAGDVASQNLIAVSVRLKEARELLDAGRVAGASLLAIEARAALSRRGGPGGTYPAQAATPAKSMQSLLEGWAADEEAPMQASLRNEVSPFYGALFAPGAAPAKTARSQVRVTLVRWPYT